MNKIYFQVMQCERINGSNLGNPNWMLTGRDEHGYIKAYKTSSNISDSYGDIPNKIYSKMPEFVEVGLTLTKANRIKTVRVLGGE